MADDVDKAGKEPPGEAIPASVLADVFDTDSAMTPQVDRPNRGVAPVPTDTRPSQAESERADPNELLGESASIDSAVVPSSTEGVQSATADPQPVEGEPPLLQDELGAIEAASDDSASQIDDPESDGSVQLTIEPGPFEPGDAPVGPPPTDAESLTATAEALGRIEHRLDEVARLGERNADHVGSLHAENQRLRVGEVATAVAPLMRDVIRIHDDILRLQVSCAAEAAVDLGLVRDLVIGTLDRWGVRPFEPLLGDSFDTAEHNGLARVETVEPLDGTVAAVRRCGFRADDGRVWRPADVEVFRQINPSAGEPSVQEE